jgi:hypothetical protein
MLPGLMQLVTNRFWAGVEQHVNSRNIPAQAAAHDRWFIDSIFDFIMLRVEI